jgi:hypothetical protein
MRWTHVMLIAVGIVVGGLLSYLPIARAAEAEPMARNPAGRYQLSAFGSGTNLSHENGCYVLDTCNGRIWRVQGQGMSELQPVGGK